MTAQYVHWRDGHQSTLFFSSFQFPQLLKPDHRGLCSDTLIIWNTVTTFSSQAFHFCTPLTHICDPQVSTTQFSISPYLARWLGLHSHISYHKWICSLFFSCWPMSRQAFTGFRQFPFSVLRTSLSSSALSLTLGPLSFLIVLPHGISMPHHIPYYYFLCSTFS